MTFVLARTVSGSLLTFNTKAQSGSGGEAYCELVRVQSARSLAVSREEDSLSDRRDVLSPSGFDQVPHLHRHSPHRPQSLCQTLTSTLTLTPTLSCVEEQLAGVPSRQCLVGWRL
jgi:hypothetical protein